METFHKSERLCSLKVISDLFENGESLVTPFFRVVWEISPAELLSPAQVAISVPKKRFRSAVQRNLIKRRIREAYRRNKHVLYSDLNTLGSRIVFIIIFRGEVIPDYESIQKNILEMISLLGKRVRKKLKIS